MKEGAIKVGIDGFYWWVGNGNEVNTEGGSVHGEIQTQTDCQTGRFSIDYMLGGSWAGLNLQRDDRQAQSQ